MADDHLVFLPVTSLEIMLTEDIFGRLYSKADSLRSAERKRRLDFDGSVAVEVWRRSYVSVEEEGEARGVFVRPVVGHDDGSVATVVSRLQ